MRIMAITAVLLSALCAGAQTHYAAHEQFCGSASTSGIYCYGVPIADSTGTLVGQFWLDTGYQSPFGFVLFSGIDNGATVNVTAVLVDQKATFTQGTHVATFPTIITVSFPGGFLTAHLTYRYNGVGRAPGWLCTFSAGAVTFY